MVGLDTVVQREKMRWEKIAEVVLWVKKPLPPPLHLLLWLESTPSL
jgi:hypothetical protein